MAELNFLSSEYVTYRLLQIAGKRGDHLRKVARLVKCHPSAIIFAEQIAGTDMVEVTSSNLDPAPSDQRVLWLVSVSQPKEWASSTIAYGVQVRQHQFHSVYAETDRGSRHISSAKALQKYDDGGHRLALGYPDRYGNDGQRFGSYLPWYGIVDDNTPGYELGMMFGDRFDAMSYAARIFQAMKDVKKLNLDNMLNSGV